MILGPCTPHSEFACRIAAAKAGLKLGYVGSKSYNFLGHYHSDGVKGCYTYKSSSSYHGTVFYNLGGHPSYSTDIYTTDISDPIPSNLEIYRLEEFDCPAKGNFYIRFRWNFSYVLSFWF